jgi:hypothetical protein
MSSPITPPQGPAATQSALAVEGIGGPAPRTAPQSSIEPAALEPSISLETLPSSPPQEVLDQMARASQIHAELSSQGRELRFARDRQSGRTQIEVRDRGGNVLRTLSPAQALEVAAGAPLE